MQTIGEGSCDLESFGRPTMVMGQRSGFQFPAGDFPGQ